MTNDAYNWLRKVPQHFIDLIDWFFLYVEVHLIDLICTGTGGQELRIASPILGSGARGAPMKPAINVAVEEICDIIEKNEVSLDNLYFRFVAQNMKLFSEICAAFESGFKLSKIKTHHINTGSFF